MEKTCQKCGKETYHNEGISKKNNKPYENYKCKDKKCDNIEWIRLEKDNDIAEENDVIMEKLDEILGLLKAKKEKKNEEEISDEELEL